MPSSVPSTPSGLAEFDQLLQDALGNLGIPSERRLVVPGSGGTLEIDLFLPQLPRAAVEIKWSDAPDVQERAMRHVTALRYRLREEFGQSVRIILVIIGKEGQPPEVPSDPPDWLKVVGVTRHASMNRTAKQAAVAIARALQDERDAFFGLGTGLALAAAAGVASTAMGGAAATTGVVGLATGAGASLLGPLGLVGLGVGWLLNRTAADQEAPPPEVVRNAPRPRRARPAKPAPAPAALPHRTAEKLGTTPPDAMIQALARQTEGILLTFRELAPEAAPVLAHEMDFLVEEFRQGHCTACALRAGRSLEFMVYELARQWQVEVLDSAFGAIRDLQSRLDQVAELVGELQVCPEGEAREPLLAQLDRALMDFNGKTYALGLGMRKQASANPSPSELGPRSVQALLKKVRKRYGGLEDVADQIKPLIDKTPRSPAGGLVGRILRTRNQAAHADVNGRYQETEVASVQILLDDIAAVLLRLSNVAVSIRKQGAQAGA